MEKFNGYEEAKAYGDYENLKLGGHICKILEVTTEKYTTKEGKPFEQFLLKIDIAEPDEQAGFFSKKFAKDAATDALKAKWKGYYRLTVPTNDSEDFTKSTFKTLITSLEKSNPGYQWNWEEQQWVGKVFAGVFGIEEFNTNDGRVAYTTKCKFVRSTEKYQEIKIPQVRLVDKTFIDYEEWLERRKAEKNNVQTNNVNTETSVFEGSNDDLPF